MISYGLKEIENILNKAHPKQIIRKVDNFKMSLFEVKYEYTTNRNNKKVGTKYFMLKSIDPQSNLEKELMDYVEEYNQENKHRQISNVKFLEKLCIGVVNI